MLIFLIRCFHACRIQEHCDDSNDIDNDAEQTSSVRKKASHSPKEMMPPTIECILTRDLVQSVRPGESIVVTGVLRGVATSGGDTAAGAYGSMSGGGSIKHTSITESLEADILMNRVIDVIGIQTLRTGALRINQQTQKILAKFARKRVGLTTTTTTDAADLELSFISKSNPIKKSDSESSVHFRPSTADDRRPETSFDTTSSLAGCNSDSTSQTGSSLEYKPLHTDVARSVSSSQRVALGRTSELRAHLRDFSSEDMQLFEAMKTDFDIFSKLVGYAVCSMLFCYVTYGYW